MTEHREWFEALLKEQQDVFLQESMGWADYFYLFHPVEEPSEYACAFCDMGDAGYSSKGPRYHDDDCGLVLAHKFLKEYLEWREKCICGEINARHCQVHQEKK